MGLRREPWPVAVQDGRAGPARPTAPSAARALGLAFLLGLSLPLHAAGWIAVLKDTPAERFDEEDLGLFAAAAKSALNAGDGAQPVVWSNPSTGSGGSFTELGHSVGKGGEPCKRMRISVYARQRPERSVTWTACRDGTGHWQLLKAS
jgi:surface antigen